MSGEVDALLRAAGEGPFLIFWRGMCGAPDICATQMSLTLTLSRQRERELERGEKFYLTGCSFFWGYSEAFYEFDYFVGDVFFFGVHRYYVIAFVQLHRSFLRAG